MMLEDANDHRKAQDIDLSKAPAKMKVHRIQKTGTAKKIAPSEANGRESFGYPEPSASRSAMANGNANSNAGYMCAQAV